MSESEKDLSENDLVESAAMSAKKVSTDAGSVEKHSISELIKAEKFLASKKSPKGFNALGFAKISPDGGR